jgi:RNA polymerase sigma factor (sigma-70 family)
MDPDSRVDTKPPLAPAVPADALAADIMAAERGLIAAVLRKDRKATAEFVSAHVDSVYAYVRHRLAPRLERVDDVVQDVFVAALASLHGFRGTSPLRAWLLGIARHKVEDFYRQRLREPEALAEPGEPTEPADEGLPIEERIDRARAAEKAQRILRMLPESYGVALLWRYWDNRSVREMAEATGKTEKAIERLLARARARFRELWGEVSHG